MKECELIKGGHTFGLLAVTPFLVLVHSVCLPANETVTHVLSLSLQKPLVALRRWEVSSVPSEGER